MRTSTTIDCSMRSAQAMALNGSRAGRACRSQRAELVLGGRVATILRPTPNPAGTGAECLACSCGAANWSARRGHRRQC